MVRVTAHARARGTAKDLASIAAEAGFADQSHLGREVRRVTGILPGRLGELMRNYEAFWFYRLLSEHLLDAAAQGPR
jgi:AraC-like DNA-binding protein